MVAALLAVIAPSLPVAVLVGLAAVGICLCSPWAGLLLVVLTTFLVPVPFSYHVGGTTLTAGRLVFFAALAGWVIQSRRHPRPTFRSPNPLDLPLLLWLAITVVAAVVNITALTNYEVSGAIRRVLTDGLDYLLPFWLTVGLLGRRPDRIRSLLEWMAGLGGFTGVLAVVEFFTHRNIFTFLHPVLPAATNQYIDQLTASGTLVRSGIFRVHSTFEQPLIFGTVEALMLPIGLALAINARDRRARLGWSVTGLVMMAGMLFTASRATYLLLLLSLVMTAALNWRRAGWQIVFMLVGVTALAVIQPNVRTQLVSSFHNRPGTELHNSLEHRLHDIGPTLAAVGRRPVVGYGPRTFESDELALSNRLPPPANTILDDAYLGQLGEGGLLGLLSLILILVVAATGAGRSRTRAVDPGQRALRAALLIAVVNWALMSAVADVYTFNAPPRLFFILLGVIATWRIQDGWPDESPVWLRPAADDLRVTAAATAPTA